MKITQVIKGPLITEKLDKARESFRQYSFIVDREATKHDVERAVETLFNVKVEAVRTIIMRGKPKRVHIRQEHQQAGKLDAATHDAKFRRLLDAIDGVAAGIGKTDHLGAGSLRLHQERREISCARERCPHLAKHAPAGIAHKIRGVAFKRMAKGVIRRDEEPAIATGTHRGTTRGFRQHPGIISPVYGIGRTGPACQIRSRRRSVQENLVPVADDFIRRQGN